MADSDVTADEKRHDQLTTAPKSTEADAEPRIEVSKHNGVTRVDIRDDASFRPGASTEGRSDS
ncbi:hypothetical protein SAMN06295879_1265 [Agreia bicolorata]|uniref:Multidrug transporter n=1 Tax=Agreia bicolorata TaxID=110935 RepID=A0A1T4XKV2_9MICO|nr:hypothetical protein [Agreia bicolorata]SKA90023.1 hypothetical protein SAMN06295879_1265 [Agreia bicolorata]